MQIGPVGSGCASQVWDPQSQSTPAPAARPASAEERGESPQVEAREGESGGRVNVLA